jgi:hypothetical protein
MKSDSGHKVLQRLAGLAAGRGPCCLLLQAQQKVSQGRSVWDHESVASILGFRGCEHRGRSWPGEFGDFRSVSSNFARFVERDGNAYYHRRKTVAWKSRRFACCTCIMRRNWQNDQVADKGYPGQKMKTLFAIRYSLFAPSECHHD